MSIKATILATLPITPTLVEVQSNNVPEGVFVQKLSIGEREIYGNKLQKAKKNTINATAFCLVARDKKGQLIFTLDDVNEVNNLPGDLVMDVLEKFNQENGFVDKDKKTPAVDEAEKN